MNFFKNIYGKLAVFYILVAFSMIYLSYEYNKKFDELDAFYTGDYNAENNGKVSNATSAEASI